MKVTADMKIRDVLAINEEKMLSAFLWLSQTFERLQNPLLRKVMSGRVTVSQAARIAQIPLTEALYVLNLAAGEDYADIADELNLLPKIDFEYHETNPSKKPQQLLGIFDDDNDVIFVDVMRQAEKNHDPLPIIMRNFLELKATGDTVMLINHPFNPIPLRDLFAREGFASWAEERTPNSWYIYIYRPTTTETERYVSGFISRYGAAIL